jgi:hypothetical protein
LKYFCLMMFPCFWGKIFAKFRDFFETSNLDKRKIQFAIIIKQFFKKLFSQVLVTCRHVLCKALLVFSYTITKCGCNSLVYV